MSSKAAILRHAARHDIDQAIDLYLERAAYDAASRFVDELEKALEHLSRYPESGSPRYAQELNLPGLRYWPVPDFPYLVFYVPGEDHLDVWRVLHADRDIPDWLRAEE